MMAAAAVSDPLLDTEQAPDAYAFTIAHLRPITASGNAIGVNRWLAGMVLPYRMVERVAGLTTIEYDLATVRVHTFGQDVNEAYREGRRTDARMMLLAKYSTTDVLMDDGSIANCDWMEISDAAHEEPYASKSVVTRVVSEYILALQRGGPA